MLKNKKIIAFIIIPILCLFLMGLKCGEEKPMTGSVALLLSTQDTDFNKSAKSILPDTDMTIQSYNIILSGPNDETITTEIDNTGTVTIENLVTGEWTINVTAINGGSFPIASGDSTVTIVSRQTANCEIEVFPLSGSGTLSLTITWDISLVESASVVGNLESSSDVISPVIFNLDETDNTYEIGTLPAGYYTLTISLYDNGIKCGGTADTVRIISNVTTERTINISPTPNEGEVSITITPVMYDPIEIVLTGALATITEGSSFTTTAAADPSEAKYTWYIDGDQMLTGVNETEYTIPADLKIGLHRLDVTVFTPDNLRGGSVSHMFEVTQLVP